MTACDIFYKGLLWQIHAKTVMNNAQGISATPII